MTLLIKIGLWGMFINYYPFHIMFGHFIPGGTYVFFGMIVAGILAGGVIRFDKTIKSWILYAVVSFILSIFALDSSYALSSLVDFCIKIVMIYAVVYVCEKESSITFAIHLLAIVAVLSAGAAFLQMSNIEQRLALDSGAAISVNDFGSLMAYGCFAVIMLLKYSKIQSHFIKQILTTAASLLLLIELFISGSRKGFYAVILLYFLLLVFVARKESKRVNPAALCSLLILTVAVCFVYFNYLQGYVQQTSMYARLFGEKASFAAASDESRLNLYLRAFSEFAQHPLFGIGFNCFKYKYGMYTHSTYADPIACSGFFSLLYLVPIFTILRKQFRYAIDKKQGRHSQIQNIELLIFYLIFLFIGLGIPYLYKEIPCIGFGLIIGWQRIYERKINRRKENHGKTVKSTSN